MNQHWTSSALCRETYAEGLFGEGATQNRAKELCTGCPVRGECLAQALDERIEHGVWGGMTARDRRALLKRRPTVQSWARLLEAAKREHAAHAPAAVRNSA
ncbi:WhiB family transcriptional regulator [Streptomyces sp. YH02]|uniref:WhiB family transcriptional regulator n=1 Tax=Streptomyces sp. YH02 TaxID=3256999 RepID=UPI003756A65F